VSSEIIRPAFSPDAATARRNLTLLDEGRRLVEGARTEGLTLRLIGGVAVMAHCPKVLDRGGSRPIADVDAVVLPRQGRALSRFLEESAGYQPEPRFNALHGHRRMLFHGPQGQLDVLVGVFEMCHRIDLSGRLHFDDPTVTLSDLLLTKLQVVELNEKDAHDALDLLESHDVARTEGDVVNLDYIDSLVASDWGLWRTVTGTLERLGGLAVPETAVRISKIHQSLIDVPKTRRWKLRARVGERVRWYVLPDEVE
jgi:hypothetical protein